MGHENAKEKREAIAAPELRGDLKLLQNEVLENVSQILMKKDTKWQNGVWGQSG